MELTNIAFSNNIVNDQYIEVGTSMGCIWYLRCNNYKLEYLFMHSDNWGQYGEETSDLPKYEKFIKKYTKIDTAGAYI